MFGSCHFDRSSKVEIGVKFWIFVYFFVFYHLKKNHATFSRSWRCPQKVFHRNIRNQNNRNNSIFNTNFNIQQFVPMTLSTHKTKQTGFFSYFLFKKVCLCWYVPQKPCQIQRMCPIPYRFGSCLQLCWFYLPNQPIPQMWQIGQNLP